MKKHNVLFEDNMKTTKQTFLVDKDYVKVNKDIFESMKNVINESKKSYGNTI